MNTDIAVCFAHDSRGNYLIHTTPLYIEGNVEKKNDSSLFTARSQTCMFRYIEVQSDVFVVTCSYRRTRVKSKVFV